MRAETSAPTTHGSAEHGHAKRGRKYQSAKLRGREVKLFEREVLDDDERESDASKFNNRKQHQCWNRAERCEQLFDVKSFRLGKCGFIVDRSFRNEECSRYHD